MTNCLYRALFKQLFKGFASRLENVQVNSPVGSHTRKSEQEFFALGRKSISGSVAAAISDCEVMFKLRDYKKLLPVECQKCSFTCDTINQLNVHARVHNDLHLLKMNSFCCPECTMTSSSLSVLIWHLSHHRGNHCITYLSCKTCKFYTMITDEMSEHERQRHAGSKSLSSTVEKRVNYLQNLRKCPICPRVLPFKRLFITHLDKDHSLTELARYIDSTYSHYDEDDPDACSPEIIKFPMKMLSGADNGKLYRSDVAVNSKKHAEILKIHCNSCEFSTNDSNEYAGHICKTVGTTSGRTITTSGLSLNKSLDKPADTLKKFNCSKCAFTAFVEAKYQHHLDYHTIYDKISTGFTCSHCAYKHTDRKCIETHIKQFHLESRDCTVERLECKEGDTTSIQKPLNKKKRRKNKNTQKTKKKAPSTKPLKKQSVEESPKSPRRTRSSTNSDHSLSSPATDCSPVVCEFDEFENKLPDGPVFTTAVKCPKCDFKNRFRVNIIRHLKQHKDRSKECSSSLSDTPSPDVHLSYRLWHPPKPVHLPNTSLLPVVDKSPAGEKSVSETLPEPTGRMTEVDDSIFEITDESSDAEDRCGDYTAKTASTPKLVSAPSGRTPSLASDEDKSAVVCEVCRDKFRTESDLERHISQIHEGPYVCHLCGVLLWLKTRMENHYNTKHVGEPVLFDVLHRENKVNNDNIAGSKKVARIQGVHRLSSVSEEPVTCKGNDAVLTQQPSCSELSEHGAARTSLTTSSLDQLHAQPHHVNTVSHTPQDPASIVSSTFSDCSSAPHLSISSCDISASQPPSSFVSLQSVSCSAATPASTSASVPSSTTYQWCTQPGAPSAVQNFDSQAFFTSAASSSQPSSGMMQASASVTPQQGWLSNFNLMTTFMTNAMANVNVESVKAALSAQLTQFLATYLTANPGMMPAVMAMFSQAVAGFTPAPQMAAMFQQFFTSIQATTPISQSTSLANQLTSRPTETVFQETLEKTSEFTSLASNINTGDGDSAKQTVLSAGVSSDVVSDESIFKTASNIPSGPGSNLGSNAVGFTTKPGMTCNLIRLPELSHQNQSEDSRTPSMSAVLSDIDSSESGCEPDSDCEATSGRPPKRRRIERLSLSPRPPSVASSVCSAWSTGSSYQRKDRGDSAFSTMDPSDVVFSCHRCPFSTTNMRSYTSHIRLEFSVTKMLSALVISQHQTHQQYQSSTPEPVHRRCSYCSFSSFLPDEFEEHLRTHVVTKRFRCVHCLFAGPSTSAVRQHMTREHPDRPFAVDRERSSGVEVPPIKFQSVVSLVDVLKLSQHEVRRLKRTHSIEVINLDM